MKHLYQFILSIAVTCAGAAAIAEYEEDARMQGTGTFEVSLEPQDDGQFAAGRMLISKTYSGAL